MIRILIFSDIRLYCDGLKDILNQEPEFEVISSTTLHNNPVDITKKYAPQVALLDLNMKEVLQLTRTIIALDPDINIIVMGVSNNEEEIIKLAETGIAGCLTREDPLSELKRVIKAAVQDEFCCSPHMARSLLRHISSLALQKPRTGELNSLTRRELQVGDLMARGLSNKEIAREVHIEISTVKNHVHNILEKLHIRRRGEVATLFQR